MIYRFMEEEKAEFPVRFMASRLGVSTFGFFMIGESVRAVLRSVL